MKIDVFDSYHTETARDVADAVVTKLEQQGLRCWYASRDAEGRFAGNIKRAIDRSSVFVVLLNKAACESRHVRSEIAIAFDKDGLEIIPLRITNEPLSDDVDYYLHGFNYINAVGNNCSSGLDELTRRIQRKLNTIAPVAKIETINYDDGSVYTGEVVNGERQGRGKLTWPSGAFYEGDWHGDKRTGKGKYVWASGNVYDGDWLNNKRTGKGRMAWSSGTYYEGDFVNGARTGTGKIVWGAQKKRAGDCYEGDFVNGSRTGTGTYTYANGEVQSGEFLRGRFLG